jgi:hypothetical protein
MKYCHLSVLKHSSLLLNTFCSIMKYVNRYVRIHSYGLSFILQVVIWRRRFVDWIEQAQGEAARSQEVAKAIELLGQIHQHHRQ